VGQSAVRCRFTVIASIVEPARGQPFDATRRRPFHEDGDTRPVATQQGVEAHRPEAVNAGEHGPGIAFGGTGRPRRWFG
jgi:hypothetical protein